MMTKDEHEKIRERCEKATPGEWRTPPTFSGICSQSGDILAINRIVNTRDADMIFICHAREDIPALLDALEAETKRAEDYEGDYCVAIELLGEQKSELAVKDAEITRLKSIIDPLQQSAMKWRELCMNAETDCDRWKTRAEALELAVKSFEPECQCDSCVNSNVRAICNSCDDNWCNWQFDEAQFAGTEGEN